MKKIIIVGLMVAASMVFTGCKDKEEKKEPAGQVQEVDSGEAEGQDMTEVENESKEINENTVDGESVLCTEDGSVSITIIRPEGFEDSEFSFEQQVAFQRLGADGSSSTQINLRLMAEDENTVITEAQREVEYLMSANSDEEGAVGEIQTLAEGERQWSFFSYSLAGEEGYRLWTSLSNGCILSCAVENIGSGLEPLAPESLIQMLSASIQE